MSKPWKTKAVLYRKRKVAALPKPYFTEERVEVPLELEIDWHGLAKALTGLIVCRARKLDAKPTDRL